MRLQIRWKLQNLVNCFFSDVLLSLLLGTYITVDSMLWKFWVKKKRSFENDTKIILTARNCFSWKLKKPPQVWFWHFFFTEVLPLAPFLKAHLCSCYQSYLRLVQSSSLTRTEPGPPALGAQSLSHGPPGRVPIALLGRQLGITEQSDFCRDQDSLSKGLTVRTTGSSTQAAVSAQ